MRTALLLALVACNPDKGTPPADTASVPAAAEPWRLVDHVDPAIGSGGIGYNVGCGYPGANLPNGLVKLSPDTADRSGASFGAYRGGGYHADDIYIQGFSHMHLYAVGLTDYGLVGVMPVDGMTADKTVEAGYRAEMDKATETSVPGRYSVELMEPAVSAELSATAHTGVHSYTFAPSVDDPTLLIDLGHVMDGSEVRAAAIALDPENGTFSGWMHYQGGMARKPFTVWLDGVVWPPPTEVGVWDEEGVLQPGVRSAEAERDGLRLGGWMSFDAETVEVQVGISTVDAEGAAANLAAQRVVDLDAAAEAAWQTWDDTLGAIEVAGGEEDDRIKYASAVYHSLQMPTLFSDVDLRYRGFDQEIHQGDRPYYTDFSLWDTYRTLHPLYTAHWPELHADTLQSLGLMVEQGGTLPRWPLATWDGGFMVGLPASIVVAEADLKGVEGWDADALLAHALAISQGEVEMPYGAPPDVRLLDEYGYYPEDLVGRSVANTQEIAIADHALAEALAARGADAATVEQLRTRADTWANLYDPATGWVHGRMSDGTWGELGNVDIWNDDYAEGNARQYLWMAPHDPDGLIEVLGGAEVVTPRLEELFEQAAVDATDDVRGVPEVHYWHGNEVDLHAAWMFNHLGQPARTQHWVDWIWQTWYGTGPDGLAGNDDGGTLSAWAAWAGMGLYPLAGTDRYVWGAPRFPWMRVRFGGDHWLEIERSGAGPVVEVRLDGVAIDGPELRHADLVAADHLHFVGEDAR